MSSRALRSLSIDLSEHERHSCRNIVTSNKRVDELRVRRSGGDAVKEKRCTRPTPMEKHAQFRSPYLERNKPGKKKCVTSMTKVSLNMRVDSKHGKKRDTNSSILKGSRLQETAFY